MEIIKRGYAGLISVGNSLQSIFLFAIRLFWGGSFILSGYGKFTHIANTADFFSSLGIPFPILNAYLTGGIEFFGGLCLLLGLFSRLAAIPLAVVMTVALFTAHSEALFSALQDPDELVKQAPFNFLLASLIVFIFGPGTFSLDRLFHIDSEIQSGSKRY